jgi:hypothetical protein
VELKTKQILFSAGVITAFILLFRKDEKTTNSEHLNSLTPKAKKQFTPFIAELTKQGFAPIITSSKRTYLKQLKLYKKDKRNAKPGTSKHEKAAAVDLVVKYKGQYLSKTTPIQTWLNTGVPKIAQKYGLKWGGSFKGYNDLVHFESV